MMNIIRTTNSLIDPLRRVSNKVFSPALDVAIRLYMANVFFKSGWLKLESYLNNDWSSTVFLFEEIHPLPGMPADIAAVAATAGEIILPILLALGLFGRLGAAGLLVMTLVIQFVIPPEYGLQNKEHYYWMMLLAVPLFKGPGIISLDHLIGRFIKHSTAR